MSHLKRVCVFCGSNPGVDFRYGAAAAQLGGLLVRRGQSLVYGGGSVGLMGIVADAVLAAGGEVLGVIPTMLATKELLHPGVTDMRQTPDMHVRKAVMAENSDAFIALPGGYGTLEEFFEMVTWAQLGIHAKPIGLLNVAGFYDPLVHMLDHAIGQGFIKAQHRDLVVVADHPDALLDRLDAHEMPAVRKWLGPEET